MVEPELNDSSKFAAFYYLYFMLATFLIVANVKYNSFKNTDMKKRFSRKAPPKKKVYYGAYDKDGKWWDRNDIQTFTGGMITLCFGKDREDIEIIVREE